MQSATPPPDSAVAIPARPRRSWRWRVLRWGLIGVASLVTLLALVLTEESVRGKRAWTVYRHEMEARGEKLDWAAFVPPPVPDEQNFAMTPFLAVLYNYVPGTQTARDTNQYNRTFQFARDMGAPPHAAGWLEGQATDLPAWALALEKLKPRAGTNVVSISRAEAATRVLGALEGYKEVVDEIRDASRRPRARFNISYGQDNPVVILLPHLSVLKRLGTIFELRAAAELALGRTNEALGDIEVGFALANSVKGEPFLISGLVRIALLNAALQPVWEALAAHQWSDTQLEELGALIGKADLLAEYDATLRGERAMGVAETEWMLTRGPLRFAGGFRYQNEITLVRMYQDLLLTGVDSRSRRVEPARFATDGALAGELHAGFRPYRIFAALLLPAVAKAGLKHAATQTWLDEAVLACGLERYRLAHGEYPPSLDALTPQFIPAPPHDLFTGDAYKYRRTDDGQFVLYSVGWNQKDDGGAFALTKSGQRLALATNGDWVWQYPAK